MKPVMICACFLLALRLSAQTAGEMDAVLETSAVNGAQATRFTLGAAGLLPAGLPERGIPQRPGFGNGGGASCDGERNCGGNNAGVSPGHFRYLLACFLGLNREA
jgi:hypothetical protein